MLEMERVLNGEEYTPGKVYTFRCPECSKTFRYDQPGEPLCTGPNESLDEHAPETMRLVSVWTLAKVDKNIDPALAEERANGPLWVPGS